MISTQGSVSVSFTYWGQSPSKSNYRFSGDDRRRRWQRIRQFESDIGWLAKSQLPHLRGGPRHWMEWSPPHVYIEAYSQRVDADNCAKAILDALEGILFENDKEVGVSVVPKKNDGPARLVITVMWKT